MGWPVSVGAGREPDWVIVILRRWESRTAAILSHLTAEASRRGHQPTRRSARAVERAVLDGLRDVLGGDGVGARQVGDGARYAQEPVVRTRGETQTRDREAEEPRGLWR